MIFPHYSVIIACSVLHNIAIDRNQPLDNEDIEVEDDHDELIPPAVPQNGGGNQNEAFIRRQGFAKRARITQHSFWNSVFCFHTMNSFVYITVRLLSWK